MSLVGPRPCIPYETETFAAHHFERFLVPAGLTGLWQVTARAQFELRRSARHGRRVRSQLVDSGSIVRLLCKTPLQLLRQRPELTA